MDLQDLGICICVLDLVMCSLCLFVSLQDFADMILFRTTAADSGAKNGAKEK